MFPKPTHHAEEEIYGPGPPSSRFREYLKNCSKTEHWTKTVRIVFFRF
jgi:hypothetical protein